MNRKDRIHLSGLKPIDLKSLPVRTGVLGSWQVQEDLTFFEKRCGEVLSTTKPILAVNSGTAAIHLALILAGIKKGDHVLCQSMTFVASVNPLLYIGAIPVFIDSEQDTWNMDPQFLKEAYIDMTSNGIQPKAVILTNIYGMPYKVAEIHAFAKANNLIIIDDSAEAMGSTYDGKSCGTMGDFGIISFNNNKIISTTGGGLLICPNQEIYERGKYLATQAKEPRPYYEHKEIGFNYRIGHMNALLGIAQLNELEERIEKRNQINSIYRSLLKDNSFIHFQTPPASHFKPNFWLTTFWLDGEKYSTSQRDELIARLEEDNIESRPLWKPMHLQPLYKEYLFYGDGTSQRLFENGICLPSGSDLSVIDIEAVVENINAYLF